MKTSRLLVFAGLSLLAVFFTASAAPKPEAELLADLNSGDPHKIISGFQGFEKYPGNTDVVPFIHKYLSHPDEGVRRKAAREAGVFHVELSTDELKQICSLLKSTNSRAVVDALKALRDINKPEAVPDILPCLQSSVKTVLRDACRTLAVIGTKDLVPSIEPLTHNPDAAVVQDAQEAIRRLQSKS